MTQSEAQSKAYQTCLEEASQQHWNAVYKALMHDGFLPTYDYVELLKLWRADSELMR